MSAFQACVGSDWSQACRRPKCIVSQSVGNLQQEIGETAQTGVVHHPSTLPCCPFRTPRWALHCHNCHLRTRTGLCTNLSVLELRARPVPTVIQGDPSSKPRTDLAVVAGGEAKTTPHCADSFDAIFYPYESNEAIAELAGHILDKGHYESIIRLSHPCSNPHRRCQSERHQSC